MAQRDYAARNSRKKKSKGINAGLLTAIAALVVIAFVATLYFIKNSGSSVTPETINPTTNAAKEAPKSQLPSRPEEVWSYIQQLESRTVPTDVVQTEKTLQLSDKQKEELRKLAEREKQAELEKAKRAEEASKNTETQSVDAQTIASKDSQTSTQPAPVTDATTATAAPVKDEATLKAEQQAIAEKRKKEEERKKAEAAQKAEQAKADAAKKAVTTETAKPATGKFGLQCGAFKNKAQAESLQARLAMSGLNARVNSSADWNRVVIGPVGDRADAVNAQKQASAITNCVIIGM
ncbi:cell division protein FtsN [Pasteurella bettyae]|uniref:Cell division protein FtsN n=1 Tax=Pasteurella bettyae CCUG 2042 TaxID=1095749 RepID=I3DJD2_9PAST|nr:cell division protein FtsN [Pasteurella bettyae]EIJ71825.1 cell division protein FtsN [Pasteurella bettyae CCUG 2042]SUB22329.1 Cell division protein FtsN [Pasteurella bettyae]